MRKSKIIHRLKAMVLSVVMVVGMMPDSTMAETVTSHIGTNGVITAFEALVSDIAMQSVSLGTSERDLELPNNLTVSIRYAALEKEPIPDSGETDTESKSTHTVSGSAIGFLAEAEEHFETDPAEKTVDINEISVSLPVTWASSPEYDGEAAGTYVFMPNLPEELTLGDGAEIPQIIVTVNAPIAGTVEAFDTLPDDIRWQNTTVPNFPVTVSGSVAGKAAQIPVTWTSEQEYDPEYLRWGLYVFTAVLGEGYWAANDAKLPHMTVYIPQTARKMARLAGSGTTDSPLEITTAAQLAEIATLVNARANGLELFLFNNSDARVSLKLMKDIDLSSYARGEGWTPIGTSSAPFKGIFDGNGNRIKGLYINRNAHFQGFFGCVANDGVIQNVGLENVSIVAGNYVGAVAGYINGIMQNCYSTGTVSGKIGVGGVVGHTYNATLRNCYSTGTVVGTTNVGGVIGTGSEGVLTNCYSTGSVYGTDDVGGVVGYSYNGTVQACAALNPSVSGTSGIGRVAGRINNGLLSGNIAFAQMTVTQEGSLKTPVEGPDQVDGKSSTAVDINAAGFFEALFGNDMAWSYAVGKVPILVGLSGQSDALPPYITGLAGAGTITDPYRIYTGADLKYMADLINSDINFANGKFFRLEDDIDLSIYGKDYDSGKGWKPIGAFVNAVFDGNGKTIAGLYINRSNETNLGLFGQVTNGTLRNLFLEAISLHSETDGPEGTIGALAGRVSGGSTISGCAATGSVTGEVTASTYCTGGLVGLLEMGSQLSNCVFYGTVSATANTDTAPPTTLPDLFAGGIVGRLNSNAAVTSCLSVSDISAKEGNASAGGIAGQVDSGARITVSAALGAKVTAASYAGRIAGLITPTADNDPDNKNYAWSDLEVDGSIVSGTADSPNGEDSDSIAIQNLWTLGELKGWDTDIWTLTQGKLPVLKGLSDLSDTLPAYIAGLSGVGGSEDNPIEVYTASMLEYIALNIHLPSISNGYIKLMNDIDFSDYEYANDRDKWKPIGNSSYPFCGTFDGGGYRILNLRCFSSGRIGLFGLVKNATIKNLGIENAYMYGGQGGGVVSEAQDSMIQNCYVTIIIGDLGPARADVGGVAGYIYSSTVEYCYSYVLIHGELAGGIASSGYYGIVKNCVVLGSYINGSWLSGRIVGFPGGTFLNNYGINGIYDSWKDKGLNKKDGADVTSQALLDASFWTTASNWHTTPWDSSIWTFEDGKLPKLKGFTGPSYDDVLFLMARDIQYAAVTPNTTHFTYNGTQQIPALTVTFDGETLIENTDYTVTITSTDGNGTSAGTKAGAVTLTVIGIGNYYGTQNLTYTIGDRVDSDGPSYTPSPSPTTAPERKPDQQVMAATPITATAGTGASATAVIQDKTITDLIKKAQADAKEQGKTANDISVELKVTMPKDATSLTLTLSGNSLNSLIDAEVAGLALNGSPISLGLDLKALQEIKKQSAGDLSINLAPATGLSKEAEALLGKRPAYSITLSYAKDGKAVNITSLGNGAATLSIPYSPGKNEVVGYLFGVYVDAKGKAQRISGSVYDVNNNSLLILTDHFSVYGVGYTSPSVKFADIGSHWAKEAIDYVVGRVLLLGTSKTAFEPDTAITREALAMALGKLAGVDVKAYATSSFTDVATGIVSLPYIEWAYQNGILKDTGNKTFNPERSVRREELAVIIENFAKATGFTLPVTRSATTYTDAVYIGSDFKAAVTALQQAGILMAGSGNRFNPKSSVTRAEASSILYRYVKLTINPTTTQGWALNDSGQYLYYKNGEALTGTHTIDGVKYFFDTTGVLKTGLVKDGNRWRYYSGNKATVGWLDIDGKRYYFTKDGLMTSGKWLKINSKWYYFYADGTLAKNTKIDGYQVGPDGVRKIK